VTTARDGALRWLVEAMLRVLGGEAPARGRCPLVTLAGAIAEASALAPLEARQR
jgi:hypothetical protein